MPIVADIHQHLAFIYPDWGERNAYSIIKIPKGEHVTFISGKDVKPVSDITKEKFIESGYKIKFIDFNEKLIGIYLKNLKKIGE